MTDPRVRLVPQMSLAGADRLLEALDSVRPIVVVGDEADRWTAAAAAALVSNLARIFPHTIADGRARVEGTPWRASVVTDVTTAIRHAIPTPTRTPTRDVRIAFGASNPAAELQVGGDDWTTSIGATPTHARGERFGLGLQAAAVFAAAETLKMALEPLGFVAVPVRSGLLWNLLDHRLSAAPTATLGITRPLSIALLGAGSVGSSAAGVLTTLPTVTGVAVVVDDDPFDPTRNPFRYPTSLGNEAGPKSAWVSNLLKQAGWDSAPFDGRVSAWVASQARPGFDGLAISSVDRVEGRLQAADVLARTTLSVGVAGMALHLQREVLGDGFVCPYCDFVDLGPTTGRVEQFREMTGLTPDRILFLLAGEKLTSDDIQAAVAARKVDPARAGELAGRRLDDMVRRVYAEAPVRLPDNNVASVVAPFVSWMGGVLIAAELVKAALGLAMVDRRVDLDLTGLPPGFQIRRPASSARCVCASPVRRKFMRELYG
jgi:hypothetical protein